MPGSPKVPRRSWMLKFYIEQDTGCFIWLAARSKDGYGVIKWNGRSITAHKWFCEMKYGPAPKGYEWDHIVCNERACINPDHCIAVPKADNVARANRRRWEMRQLAEQLDVPF